MMLIGVSIAMLFFVTSSLYKGVEELQTKQSVYDEALNNSKALENERDKLTAKYSTISTENLSRIKKFLPDSVDNIRLILEIEKLALPYGMALKDVQYSVAKSDTAPVGGAVSNSVSGRDPSNNRGYGSWELEFAITGTYNNFLNFTKNLENNLRMVDIDTIQFTAGAGASLNSASPEVYRFAYKIRTYWLKN